MKRIFTYLLISLTISIPAVSQTANGLNYICDSTLGDALSLRKMDIDMTPDGTVFIGYYGAGLGMYQDEELSLFNIQNSEMISDRVNSIYADFFDVCIGTENGLAVFSQGEWEFPGGGLSGFHVESTLKESSSIYALCSKDDFIDSLAVYDGLDWTFVQFPGFTRSFLNNTPMVLHNGTLYFGTRQEGLFSFDGEHINHLLYNTSINDLIVYDNQLWISLNTLYPNGESILIYDLSTHYLLGFSHHKAYEPTHSTKGAAFGYGLNGRLNIVYVNQTELIINSLNNETHDIMIYPDQPLGVTKVNATDEFQGITYITTWSYLPALIADRAKHISFLSGFWSKNIKTLDINKVGATVKSFGSMFWDGNAYPRYEVPIDSGTNSIFASGIWVGGYDQNDNLHMSAVRYSENSGSNLSSYDFAPGTLIAEGEDQGQGDTLISNRYDRVWKIDRYDIEQFNYQFNRSWTIPDDLEEWPGNLPEGEEELAPFVDINNDGEYNSEDGDYPLIKGDQMLWWVINDNTHPNEETGGTPLGIEIQNSFYGFRYDSPADEFTNLINYQTYLNVKIINRSKETYDSVYIGIWVDSDIGYAFDDYIGCDVERNSFYFYNADGYDESFMDYTGYGYNPPVQTVTILNGPLADADGVDNDEDGIVDNERLKMNRFLYYNNTSQGSNPATTDPFEAEDYYNYLTGRWKDGTPVCYGGNGHYYGGGDINIPCNYMFPGDTDPDGTGTNGIPQPEWDEETEGNTPDDRRGLCSIGPFTMESGEQNEIDILFAYIPNDGTRTGNFNYQPCLDSLITWYNEDRIPSNYEDANQLSVSDQDRIDINIHPNPAKDRCIVRSDKNIEKIEIFDIHGKKVKQISVNNTSQTVSTSDWNKGVYFIKISSDNQTITRKLIVI